MIHLLSTTSQHEMGKTRVSTFLSISCFQSSTLPETKILKAPENECLEEDELSEIGGRASFRDRCVWNC